MPTSPHIFPHLPTSPHPNNLTLTLTLTLSLSLSLTRCRDFYMPVGGHVKLRTLPQCFNCGQDTEFTWLSCPWCRYSTKKRKRAKDPSERLPQG